ncbi:MAG: PAS domain S-box protein, partial [Acidobacteriaceae bacterium]|nr:PAS domain S-box protein [Acidobacteriaceae bacterium]
MTIAHRLALLLALPIAVLVALSGFCIYELMNIQKNSRFLGEVQIESLAALGNISGRLEDARVELRNCLLAENTATIAEAAKTFDNKAAELTILLARYGDSLISDETDRRQYTEFRELNHDWTADAKRLISLASSGHTTEARDALFSGDIAKLGPRLGDLVSSWTEHNKVLARQAGNEVSESIQKLLRNLMIATAAAMLLSLILGYFTFRRIVHPIQALQTSVQAIAGGDYTQAVPFTTMAGETGELARSVAVLKQDAAEKSEQRWLKSSVAKLSSILQTADSVQAFGEKLLSEAVPLLGGGAAALYVFETDCGRLRRAASYGLANGAAEFIAVGEGLAGECVRQRAPITITNIPPAYFRVSSALGSAPPVQTTAWPIVSLNSVLGVLELASFRELSSSENAFVVELLPVAALNLEILSRNIATTQLLLQTQKQAEELEASEERSRLILESTADGIYGTDAKGLMTFINPAACHMLGFTQDELLGQPCHATFHHHRPDGSEYPKEECPMFAAYTKGKSSHVDSEFLWRKDGTGVPVEYSARPVSKNGSLIGSVVSFTDITERRHAEERLRDTERFFRSVLESAPDAMMVVDQNGGI